MNTGKYINRRLFLKFASFTLAAASLSIWRKLILRQQKLDEEPAISRINVLSRGTGIFFFDKYILVKTDNGIQVFSNRCTHAGCLINKENGGQLVCPCHGSRFDASTGKVLQGPAGMALRPIPFSYANETGEIVLKTKD